MRRTYRVTLLVDIDGDDKADIRAGVESLQRDPPWLDRVTAGHNDKGWDGAYSIKTRKSPVRARAVNLPKR
jgi:hypothetical protein